MFNEVLAIFIGGGLGAVLRYLVTRFSHHICGLPHLGTFIANIAGCFLMATCLESQWIKSACQMKPNSLLLWVSWAGLRHSALLITKLFVC